jgi:exosortase/archaeosortase family protein
MEGRVAGSIARQLHGRPPKAGRRAHVLLRVLVVSGAVIAGYNYSLLTLMRTLGSDMPLAYLGLVPVISVLLGVVALAVPRHDPNIHDRHLDYIVGVPLLIASMVMLIILPVPLSTFFWLWRIDLLSLPLFVAGLTSIVFGIRALWRLRIAIAFLWLAWPVPYEFGFNSWIERFSTFTIAALRRIVAAVPVARPVASADGSLFVVIHAGKAFTIGVSSACAGANGLVGFLLIGAALLAVVRGNWLPKVIWLAVGLMLIWILNLIRMTLIFAAGAAAGESFAIDGLHPFIGVVTFNFGVLAMLLMMPAFGLRIGNSRIPEHFGARAVAAAWQRLRESKPAVQKAGLAIGVAVLAATMAAPADASMQRFELLSHDLGPTRLAFTSDANAGIDGWLLTPTSAYDWAPRYFGSGATWDRYVYTWDPDLGRSAAYRSGTPVTMDVIRTQDLHSFTEYGIEACYRFHNYQILADQLIDLGGGVTGHAVAYAIPDLHETWSAVYWEWPVDGGVRPTYERVLVNRLDLGDDRPIAPVAQLDLQRAIGMAISNAVSGSRGVSQTERSLKPLAFLASFSRHVLASVADRTAAAAPGAQ